MNLLKCIIFFLFSWFLLAYPYISDFNIFFKSILESLHYTSFNQQIPNSDFYFLKNILNDFLNFKINFFLILIVLFFPIIFFSHFKSILINKKLIIPFYLISIISYLFINVFLDDYDNHFPAKYLYNFFILFFVLILINSLSISLAKFNFLLVPIFLISLLNLIINFNLYLNFKNFLNLKFYSQNIFNTHSKIFSGYNKLYICDGVYPVDNIVKNISIIRLSYDECMKIIDFKKISQKDLILINGNEYSSNNILDNLSKHYEDNHDFLSRYGVIRKINFNFYKLPK